MSLLNESLKAKKFDNRLLGRNQKLSILSSEEVDKSISDLPDDSSNASFVSIEDVARWDGKSRFNPRSTEA